MIPSIPFTCPKRVGFLFPHPCERLTSIGCPDCNNGSIDDPYRSRTDRRGYDSDFDRYSSTENSWSGGDAPLPPTYGGGDAGGAGASMDFTEADGETLTGSDRDFENDLSAS